MQPAVFSDSAADGGGGPLHLVLLVNGLWSCAGHWKLFAAQLRETLGPSALVHAASTANPYLRTLSGMSACWARLARRRGGPRLDVRDTLIRGAGMGGREGGGVRA